MTLLPTFLAGTNFVMHAAGWLEGGLVSCYEKFIIDIELLRDAAGGVHPAGDRPRNRWRSARTRRSATAGTSSAPRTRWSGSASASTARCCPPPRTTSAGCKLGGKDTAARAGEIWRKKLEDFTPPPLDDAIRAELETSWPAAAASSATSERRRRSPERTWSRPRGWPRADAPG